MRFSLALLTGCVPHLYSEGGDSGPKAWAPVENTWKQCGTPPASFYEEPTGYDVGERFPDLRLGDQNGDTVSLWQFTGCVMIVDLSTEWCRPCQLLAQEVDALYADFEAQGLMYVTLISDTTSGAPVRTETLTTWAEAWGVTTTPILADTTTDEDPTTYSEEITSSFPYVLAIDRDMRITNDSMIGLDVETSEKLIKAEIERLLAE